MALDRLDKLLSVGLGISRKDASLMIRKGCVQVNGAVVQNGAEKFSAEQDCITADGTPVFVKKHLYIMLHKPQGVVSASEGRGEATVVDILPPDLKRRGLFPAGRLDKDTTGFVLITDDGNFAHSILAPKKHVEKTYEARLQSPLTEAAVQTLEGGMELRDGTVFRPARLQILENTDTPLVQIVICEGKYHQIKRMFKAVGNGVAALHRTKIGNLELDPVLLPGECREITKEELLKIKN